MDNIKFDDFGYEGLKVYRMAYLLAMDVFTISKSFPSEEKYSLTDQLRRSSRSVCANLAEGYRKRVYSKSFAAKIVDADAECSETMVHLKFANSCNYIQLEILESLELRYVEVGKILNHMALHPEKFLPRNKKT